MIGKIVQVMIEGESKLVTKPAYPSSGNGVELGWEKRRASSESTTTTQLVGRTRGDQVVVFDGEKRMKGQLVDVEIVDAKNLTLFARMPTAALSPV
jgi:hypothetical protein